MCFRVSEGLLPQVIGQRKRPSGDYRNNRARTVLFCGQGFGYEKSMSGKDGTKDGKTRSEAELRTEGLARTLRENLQRRKQQARARRAGDADQATGLPAAKKDESDG